MKSIIICIEKVFNTHNYFYSEVLMVISIYMHIYIFSHFLILWLICFGNILQNIAIFDMKHIDNVNIHKKRYIVYKNKIFLLNNGEKSLGFF